MKSNFLKNNWMVLILSAVVIGLILANIIQQKRGIGLLLNHKAFSSIIEDSAGVLIPKNILKDSIGIDLKSGKVFWPCPQKIRRIGICYANEQIHLIHIEASKILVDSLKLNQFGEFGYWEEGDFFRLRVDSRYDFEQVLTYLQQF